MSDPLPDADEYGLLPEGVHDASMDAVDAMFGGFQRSDRRPKLMEKLRAFVDEISRINLSVALIIDGSFVMTSVDQPNDVDMVVVLPGDWDLTQPVQPMVYNVLSRKRVQKRFGFDVFVVREGSQELANWTEFFAGLRLEWYHSLDIPVGTRKGLIRVKP